MGKEMTRGEFLNILASRAGDYHKKCLDSVIRNNHMNELSKEDIKLIKEGLVGFSQRFGEAVIIDFINSLAAENFGIDYAIYTKDLPEEFEKNREKEKK